VTERDLLNCGGSARVEFAFRCPVGWANLTPTDNPRQRHCTQCARTVFLCVDVIEAGIRADQGECIAVPADLAEAAREEAGAPRGIIVGMGKKPSDWLLRAWERLYPSE
jgi:hypothetical protein